MPLEPQHAIMLMDKWKQRNFHSLKYHCLVSENFVASVYTTVRNFLGAIRYSRDLSVAYVTPDSVMSYLSYYFQTEKELAGIATSPNTNLDFIYETILPGLKAHVDVQQAILQNTLAHSSLVLADLSNELMFIIQSLQTIKTVCQHIPEYSQRGFFNLAEYLKQNIPQLFTTKAFHEAGIPAFIKGKSREIKMAKKGWTLALCNLIFIPYLNRTYTPHASRWFGYKKWLDQNVIFNSGKEPKEKIYEAINAHLKMQQMNTEFDNLNLEVSQYLTEHYHTLAPSDKAHSPVERTQNIFKRNFLENLNNIYALFKSFASLATMINATIYPIESKQEETSIIISEYTENYNHLSIKLNDTILHIENLLDLVGIAQTLKAVLESTPSLDDLDLPELIPNNQTRKLYKNCLRLKDDIIEKRFASVIESILKAAKKEIKIKNKREASEFIKNKKIRFFKSDASINTKLSTIHAQLLQANQAFVSQLDKISHLIDQLSTDFGVALSELAYWDKSTIAELIENTKLALAEIICLPDAQLFKQASKLETIAKNILSDADNLLKLIDVFSKLHAATESSNDPHATVASIVEELEKIKQLYFQDENTSSEILSSEQKNASSPIELLSNQFLHQLQCYSKHITPCYLEI